MIAAGDCDGTLYCPSCVDVAELPHADPIEAHELRPGERCARCGALLGRAALPVPRALLGYTHCATYTGREQCPEQAVGWIVNDDGALNPGGAMCWRHGAELVEALDGWTVVPILTQRELETTLRREWIERELARLTPSPADVTTGTRVQAQLRAKRKRELRRELRELEGSTT